MGYSRGTLEIPLTAADLAELDRAFPPPKKPIALEGIRSVVCFVLISVERANVTRSIVPAP